MVEEMTRMHRSRFDFKDINLIPRKCIVSSRSECCTKITLGKYTFKMPIVPANMECVIDDALAEKLATHGYFYIHHRFGVDNMKFARIMMDKDLPISISVGVNQQSRDMIRNMRVHGMSPDYITIDIAHGHAESMEHMIKWIRSEFKDEKPFIIAGNVSTAEAVKDLEEWGADAVKVGIGPGSACTTYTATGFGSRHAQASVVFECAQGRKNPHTKIIADGGIREPGDIAKAFVLGADMVMIGGMFSGLSDSPGNTVCGEGGRLYKEFWGSASAFQSGKSSRIEGIKTLIPLKNKSVLEEMHYLKECLQSAISYGGGKNLACFKDVVWF